MQWCWQDLRWERALLESPLPPRPIRGLTFDGAGAMPTSSSEQRLSTLQSLRHISPGPIPPARLRSFLLACRVSCPHPPCKHRLLANHWLGMNSLSFQLYLPPCCLEWGGGGGRLQAGGGTGMESQAGARGEEEKRDVTYMASQGSSGAQGSLWPSHQQLAFTSV